MKRYYVGFSCSTSCSESVTIRRAGWGLPAAPAPTSVNRSPFMASSPPESAHDQVDVNSFETGEWFNYTLNVSTTGAYNVALRAISGTSISTQFRS